MKEREDNENGLDFIIEEILKKKCQIYPQSFHGGEMNGVCCRRLLKNIPEIMNIIKDITTQRLLSQCDVDLKRCSPEKLTNMLQKFQNVFRVLDDLFSLLHIPGPEDEEVNDIRENLIVLEKMWNELHISITPKAHVLFDHTLEQVIEFGGIADKVEDYVEKAHRIGKKLDHFTSHLKSNEYQHKQNIQIKRMLLH